MKNFKILLSSVIVFAFASCGINNNSAQNNAVSTDSSTNQAIGGIAERGLFAKMTMKDTIKAGELVELKFTVYNNADTTQRFCKWHTPFEPFISKYLDIKSDSGEEINYKGAMAKRIMPPPADSYLSVNPKDSVANTVDLLKGYDIAKPARYTIKYVGQDMSGLTVQDSISFIYAK